MSELNLSIKELWKKIDQLTPQKYQVNIESPNFVIAGLLNKSFSNCCIATELIFREHEGEALILFRSALEALILQQYLYLNQEDIKNYMWFSRIVEYRDLKKAIEKGSLNNQDAKTTLEELKNDIKSELQIDDREFLERVRKNSFKKASEMIESFEKNHPDFHAEMTILYNNLLYNVASQLTHAHWRPVCEYHIGIGLNNQSISPLYHTGYAFSDMLTILKHSIKLSDSIGLTDNIYTPLEAYLEKSAVKALEVIKTQFSHHQALDVR